MPAAPWPVRAVPPCRVVHTPASRLDEVPGRDPARTDILASYADAPRYAKERCGHDLAARCPGKLATILKVLPQRRPRQKGCPPPRRRDFTTMPPSSPSKVTVAEEGNKRKGDMTPVPPRGDRIRSLECDRLQEDGAILLHQSVRTGLLSRRELGRIPARRPSEMRQCAKDIVAWFRQHADLEPAGAEPDDLARFKGRTPPLALEELRGAARATPRTVARARIAPPARATPRTVACARGAAAARRSRGASLGARVAARVATLAASGDAGAVLSNSATSGSTGLLQARSVFERSTKARDGVRSSSRYLAAKGGVWFADKELIDLQRCGKLANEIDAPYLPFGRDVDDGLLARRRAAGVRTSAEASERPRLHDERRSSTASPRRSTSGTCATGRAPSSTIRSRTSSRTTGTSCWKGASSTWTATAAWRSWRRRRRRGGSNVYPPLYESESPPARRAARYS